MGCGVRSRRSVGGLGAALARERRKLVRAQRALLSPVAADGGVRDMVKARKDVSEAGRKTRAALKAVIKCAEAALAKLPVWPDEDEKSGDEAKQGPRGIARFPPGRRPDPPPAEGVRPPGAVLSL